MTSNTFDPIPAERGSTIYALSSGSLPSGVAVVRVSGPQVGFVLETMCGGRPAPRFAALRDIRNAAGEVLDQGLVLYFEGPRSFTGEDVAELQLHGGRAVVAAVLDCLSGMEGLSAAEPGAFTRRAFEAGRLDLTEVEGLGDLLTAETEAQRRQALRQMGGSLGALYEDWSGRLTRARAMIEADFDFADEEDVPGGVSDGIWVDVDKVRLEISRHLDDGRKGERLRNGLQVVLLGPPNAGKSSLLNALAQRDAAIVTEEAGTTRDVIEVHLDLGGFPVTLVDTAGVRGEGAGAIEREGIRRALNRARGADLVLWMNDVGTAKVAIPPELLDAGIPVWDVTSKTDLAKDSDSKRSMVSSDGLKSVGVSVVSDASIAALVSDLAAFAAQSLGSGEDVHLSRLRHREGLEDCRRSLERALEMAHMPLELRSEDLRRAAHGLARIVGKRDVEDLLDVIFRDFCIGK